MCVCNIQLEGFSVQLEVFDDVCIIHDRQGVCERSVVLFVSVIDIIIANTNCHWRVARLMYTYVIKINIDRIALY